MPSKLTTIGFDADDTLWQNEQFYRLTERQFAELLADHASHEQAELWRVRQGLALFLQKKYAETASALAPAGWIVRYSLRVRAASLAPSAVD